MSATASAASVPQTPSSSVRRSHAERDRYPPQTTPTRASAAPTSPQRSLSQSQGASHSRSSSAAHQLANVGRRDYEQTDVAHPTLPSQQEGGAPLPTRSDSTRQTSTARPAQHSRYDSQDLPPPPSAPTSNANGSTSHNYTSSHEPSRHASSAGVRRRTTIDATTGSWELGKTIGAGSMGKVKLAKNKETGEQVAVKIVPCQSTEEHRTAQDRERADHSKEVRTAREAAIVTLVDHPYICGMRDVVRTNYHWYMLFEYVNGGQMLDYIISHGRLKEKQARKFGRQIASALDYCHRNSIVHRDLKIENILISKTGDIKIIDFGLSNTFAPKSVLKTFCGSLYFAAPELLQAKAYVGPEVDVWSFGIVLYVLVCGKVPFDDQSMPQLHAKIKKGIVEYPPWLSTECRNLISRMLVTDPLMRAPLSEILTHPWMTKGFGGPPENYLPPRKPLQLPLDPVVLQKMDGFDFGSADVIESQLTSVIQSEDYQKAVLMAERRSQMATPELERKRGVFDFYKRRNSTTSRETLSGLSSEAVQFGADPVNAFHPLLSVYFLVKEKIDREKRESNPGALSIPSAHGEKAAHVPELRAPPSAYTNASTYEMAGEKTGGRSRPRARTHGEDEVTEEVRKLNINSKPSPAIVLPPQEQTPVKKEGVATGLLRRFSTRRHREAERPSPTLPTSEFSTPRKSFSMRRQRDRDASATRLKPDPEIPVPPLPATEPTRKTGLGRAASVSAAERRDRSSRRGASEGGSAGRPPMTPSHSSRRGNADERMGDAASDVESSVSRSAAPASRTKSVGHARKESYQARRVQRTGLQGTENVPEETEQDLQEELEDNHAGSSGESPGIKPVYLKGLFSVSTTSSKPLSVIRGDIIRTLKQLGVEYREIKGGFSCRHAPSIDVKRNEEHDRTGGHLSATTPSHRRKISFGGFKSGSSNTADHDGRPPSTPTGQSRRDNSYGGSEEESDDSENATANATRMSQQGRPPGETSTHVQSDLGSSMALKFEIFVVKVPILNIHGIQFKKVDGGTWQYKNMAQTILNELRL